MSRIPRHAKITAKQGRGADLANLLLATAADLADNPGCELYLVNREAGEADTIWVTELWRGQADLDASLEDVRGSDAAAKAIALVDAWEMIELEELGGKGPKSPQ
jgi:quinol monooxygenase YgiN